MKKFNSLLITTYFALLFFLAGCNFPTRQGTESPPRNNATQAYQTVIARVTEMFLLTGTPIVESVTPGSTSTGMPTATPSTSLPTSTPSPTQQPSATTIPCDKAAPGDPIDVTIPDDSEIGTGQTFTKVWRLVNVGTCTWTTDYDVVFVSGDQMDAPNVVPMPRTVAPGQSVDISVSMTAPSDPDTYQGNWRLRNAGGVLFSIGPNGQAPFWVRIEVIPITNTPSVTPTGSATPTPTSTTGVTDTPSATPTETPTPTETATNTP